MDDICVKAGELHTIMFESSFIQSEFRKLFEQYFHSRKSEEENYLEIINPNRDKIKSSEFFFISFDCNIISLQNDKNTVKTLKDLLFYYLEHNSELINQYMNFNENLDLFTSNLEIGNDDLIIEFYPTERTIKSLLQSLEITIEYCENKYVPNHLMRNYLIRSLLKMNVQEKKAILLLSFPETDVGLEDLSKAIDLLSDLNITTLIITTHPDILVKTDIDNLFLVNKNGEFYDIIKLKKELIAFNIVEKEKVQEFSKLLAYQDFNRNYTILDRFLKDFLNSSRF